RPAAALRRWPGRAAGTFALFPACLWQTGSTPPGPLFPTMWFDRAKCADGLQSLRHYRYDTDDAGRFSKNPVHDHASHGSDGLRYVATAMNGEKRRLYGEGKRATPPPRLGWRSSAQAWMR